MAVRVDAAADLTVEMQRVIALATRPYRLSAALRANSSHWAPPRVSPIQAEGAQRRIFPQVL
jgi:hypothetical protein